MSEEFRKGSVISKIVNEGYIPLELLGPHAQRIFWEIVEKKHGKEFARKAKQEHEHALKRKGERL